MLKPLNTTGAARSTRNGNSSGIPWKMHWRRHSSPAVVSKADLGLVKAQQRPGAWAGITCPTRLELLPWAQVLWEGRNPASSRRTRNFGAHEFVGRFPRFILFRLFPPVNFTSAIGLTKIGLKNPQQANLLDDLKSGSRCQTSRNLAYILLSFREGRNSAVTLYHFRPRVVGSQCQ